MYHIACQEVSGLACPFVADGETMEASMEALKQHGMEAHAEELQKMMADGMTEEMMMEKMKSVAKMDS